MGARTDQQFLDKLNAMRPHTTIDGEVVNENVAKHPSFRNVATTFAELFDLQYDPRFKNTLTYPSPSTGDPVGISFLIPETVEDLERRRAGMQVWAEHTHGFLGRSGDYMNSCLTALANDTPGLRYRCSSAHDAPGCCPHGDQK